LILAGPWPWQECYAAVHIYPLSFETTLHRSSLDTITSPADSPPAARRIASTSLAGFSSTERFNNQAEIIYFYENLFKKTWHNSPTLQIAIARKRQKDAEHFTAVAKRLAPAITGELSRVHKINLENEEESTDTEASVVDSTTEEEKLYLDGTDHSDWNLSMRMPLYNRATSLRMTEAGLNVAVASNQLTISTQELDIQLRETLVKFLVASYRLLNLTNSVNLAKEHVGRINRGFELRDQTKLQLLQAQANLQELEARRDLYSQNRDSALLDLLNLIGLSGDDPTLTELQQFTATEQQTADCINALAALENAYRNVQGYVENTTDKDLTDCFEQNSLRYKNIKLTHQLAQTQAKQYTQDNWPELAIKGDYGRKEDTSFSDLDGEGSLAVVLSIPLFSGGTLYSDNRTKTMAEQVARIAQADTLRRTIHLITNYRSLIQSLRKVHATQQTQLEQQQEIVRLSLKSYDIKQTSMQDLLTATNRLIDAKNALMETTATLSTLYRKFAWEIGKPFPMPSPPAEIIGERLESGGLQRSSASCRQQAPL